MRKKLEQVKSLHNDEKSRLSAYNNFQVKYNQLQTLHRQQTLTLQTEQSKVKAAEEKLLGLKIDLRRETMIKTLLDMRKSKNTEDNIKKQITTFQTMCEKEKQLIIKNKQEVEKDIKLCEDEINKAIPEKVLRFEKQMDTLGLKKPQINDQITKAKEEEKTLEADKKTLVHTRQQLSKLTSATYKE